MELCEVESESLLLHSIHSWPNSANLETMKEHTIHNEYKVVVSLSPYLWRKERIWDGAIRFTKSKYRTPSY